MVYFTYTPTVCNALSLTEAPFLNHKVDWQGGIIESVCADLLIEFFRLKRRKKGLTK